MSEQIYDPTWFNNLEFSHLSQNFGSLLKNKLQWSGVRMWVWEFPYAGIQSTWVNRLLWLLVFLT